MELLDGIMDTRLQPEEQPRIHSFTSSALPSAGAAGDLLKVRGRGGGVSHGLTPRSAGSHYANFVQSV